MKLDSGAEACVVGFVVARKWSRHCEERGALVGKIWRQNLQLNWRGQADREPDQAHRTAEVENLKLRDQIENPAPAVVTVAPAADDGRGNLL
ncbi:unnamed protein product [Allacma fusca]|uniref:Uncharacterized protein n=1 Tax=Allacma fusca TaxID=39272 RepID=A0A8J2PL96_9HEXA|nr:unnamed protein product [Allacma fusca]